MTVAEIVTQQSNVGEK